MTQNPNVLFHADMNFVHFTNKKGYFSFREVITASENYLILSADISGNDGVLDFRELSASHQTVWHTINWGPIVDHIGEMSQNMDGAYTFIEYCDMNSPIFKETIELLSACAHRWLKVGKPFHIIYWLSGDGGSEDTLRIPESSL